MQQMQPAPEEEGEQDEPEEIMPAAKTGPRPPKIPPPRQTRKFSWKPGEGRLMPVVISARPGYPRYDGPAQQAVQADGFCELYSKVEH